MELNGAILNTVTHLALVEDFLEECEDGVWLECAGLRVAVTPVQLHPRLRSGSRDDAACLKVTFVAHHHDGHTGTSDPHDLQRERTNPHFNHLRNL